MNLKQVFFIMTVLCQLQAEPSVKLSKRHDPKRHDPIERHNHIAHTELNRPREAPNFENSEFVTIGLQFDTNDPVHHKMKKMSPNFHADLIKTCSGEIEEISMVSGDKLYKISPSNEVPSAFTPFWTDESNMKSSQQSPYTVINSLALPTVTWSFSYEQWMISALHPTTVFKCKIAPAQHIPKEDHVMAAYLEGGGFQYLVLDRSKFSPPSKVPEGTVLTVVEVPLALKVQNTDMNKQYYLENPNVIFDVLDGYQKFQSQDVFTATCTNLQNDYKSNAVNNHQKLLNRVLVLLKAEKFDGIFKCLNQSDDIDEIRQCVAEQGWRGKLFDLLHEFRILAPDLFGTYTERSFEILNTDYEPQDPTYSEDLACFIKRNHVSLVALSFLSNVLESANLYGFKGLHRDENNMPFEILTKRTNLPVHFNYFSKLLVSKGHISEFGLLNALHSFAKFRYDYDQNHLKDDGDFLVSEGAKFYQYFLAMQTETKFNQLVKQLETEKRLNEDPTLIESSARWYKKNELDIKPFEQFCKQFMEHFQSNFENKHSNKHFSAAYLNDNYRRFIKVAEIGHGFEIDECRLMYTEFYDFKDDYVKKKTKLKQIMEVWFLQGHDLSQYYSRPFKWNKSIFPKIIE